MTAKPKTSVHFTNTDFANCTPPSSINDMSQSTLNKLDAVRVHLGRKPIITSAFRSPEHDRSRGRSGTGAHTTGRAVDIGCITSTDRMRVVEAGLKAGFRRIGIAATFIHLDDSPTHAQNVIWLYND